MSKDITTCMRWCPSINFDSRNSLLLLAVWMLGYMGYLPQHMLRFWVNLLDFPCLLHTHLRQLKPAFQPGKKLS
jgi:hypothetical protein